MTEERGVGHVDDGGMGVGAKNIAHRRVRK